MTNNHVSLHIQAIPSPPGFNYGKNKSFYKATLPHKKPIFHTFVWVYSPLKAGVHPKKIFLQIQTFQGIYGMFQHMTTVLIMTSNYMFESLVTMVTKPAGINC